MAMSKLGPVPTPSQRLAQTIRDFDTRLEVLERTRAATSISDVDPTELSAIGAKHLNRDQNKFWTYTGNDWVLRSLQHGYAETLSTFTSLSTTAHTTDTFVPGPELNVFARAGSAMAIAVDVETQVQSNACGACPPLPPQGDAEVWIYIEPHPTTNAAATEFKLMASHDPANPGNWWRRSFVAGDYAGTFPPGEFVSFNVSVTANYRIGLEVAPEQGGMSVNFRNRHLYVVVF